MLSLIVTTFKRPALLPRALRSAFRQRLSAGDQLEIIVSDDDPEGSGLQSLSTVQSEYATTIAVKYIKRAEGPGGVAASRNRALNAVGGEWIAFLDDDDCLVEDALLQLLEYARANRATFCAGNYIRVYEDLQGATLRQILHQLHWSNFDQLLIGNQFPMGAFIIHRNQARIPFNTNLRTHEDWLFLLDNLQDATIAILDKPVLEVHQVLDASREHRNATGGTMQTASDYLRIYSLHPAAHVLPQRKATLLVMGMPHLDTLISGGTILQSQEPEILATSQGRFLIFNPSEPAQASLLATRQYQAVLPAITAALLFATSSLVFDMGAQIGTFCLPLALKRPDIQLVCTEAEPLLFLQLCANLAINSQLKTLPLQRVPLSADELIAHNPEAKASVLRLGCAIDILGCLTGAERYLACCSPYLLFTIAGGSESDVLQKSVLQYLFLQGYVLLKIHDDFLAYKHKVCAPDILLDKLAKIGIV